jgi:hypothetical protein
MVEIFHISSESLAFLSVSQPASQPASQGNVGFGCKDLTSGRNTASLSFSLAAQAKAVD